VTADRNPYSAPESRVVDPVEPARQRPLAVKRAVAFLCLDAVVSLVYLIVDWRFLTSLMRTPVFVIYEMVALAVMVWLIIKIATGRNWARITWLILGLVTWPFTLYGLSETAARAPVAAGILLVMLGIDLSVSYLLFFAGREFFAKEKA